jgi:hypothetical protein
MEADKLGYVLLPYDSDFTPPFTSSTTKDENEEKSDPHYCIQTSVVNGHPPSSQKVIL